MKYHPDHNPNVSEEEIKEVNKGYKVLLDIALEEKTVIVSLSEELRKKWEEEEEDMFSLFNPCPRCHGARVIEVSQPVRKTCPKCGGTTVVKLKCKYCDNGTFTQRSGRKVPCRVCHGTGIWKEVPCDRCNPFHRIRHNFWKLFSPFYDDAGIIYEENFVEVMCPDCLGRGKIKFEPLNPVIKMGAILKTKNLKRGK